MSQFVQLFTDQPRNIQIRGGIEILNNVHCSMSTKTFPDADNHWAPHQFS